MMTRLLRTAFAFLLGVLIAAILIDGLLRTLPVPMGLYRTEQYQRWPLMGNEPHRPYSFSMGWEMRFPRKGTTNNYGHLAPFDYVPGSHPVIVVGDSFIDSRMNVYKDTLQSQLAALLGNREGVYGLGFNGLSISDYMAVSALAADEFAPRAAVFLIIDGDVGESLQSRLGYHWFALKDGAIEPRYRPLQGDTAARKLRGLTGDSALYRYLQRNLHFPERLLRSLGADAESESGSSGARSKSPSPDEIAVVDHFVGKLSSTLRLAPSCIAFMFHADTFPIVNPKDATTPKDSPDLTAYFRDRARQAGYRVVEMGGKYRADYEAHGERLDFWPLDRHLNGRGHGIVARAAYEALFPDGQASCPPGGPER